MALHFNPRTPLDGLEILWDPADINCTPDSGSTFYNIMNPSKIWNAYNSPTWDQNGVIFDGSNDMIVYGHNDDYQKLYYGAQRTITVSFRRISELGSGRIISRPWNGSGQYNYGFTYQYQNNDANYVNISLLGESNQSYGYNVTDLTLDDTHVITLVFGLYNVKIFCDGVLRTTQSHGITTTTNQYGDFNTLTIGTLYPYGTWSGNEGFSFGGKVYHVSVYSRELSDDEVVGLHGHLISRV